MPQSCFHQQTPANCLLRTTVVLAAVLITTMTGCIGLVANLIHASHGNLVMPAFDGLQTRRVAVVCMSNAGSFGPSSISNHLSREITSRLRKNVAEIEVIEQRKIADWMDQHDWNEVDYQQLGQGVDTEVLVAVELNSFSLHEGQTMFKGRADVTITVYDVSKGGQVIYETNPPQIQFPTASGHHATDISETEFRRKFVQVLSDRIARHFYAYDMKEDFAQDSSLIAH